MGFSSRIAWTAKVEGDDGEAPIHIPSKVYVSSGGCQKRVGMKGGHSREHGSICRHCDNTIFGSVNVRP